jgi:hypothetical protein
LKRQNASANVFPGRATESSCLGWIIGGLELMPPIFFIKKSPEWGNLYSCELYLFRHRLDAFGADFFSGAADLFGL